MVILITLILSRNLSFLKSSGTLQVGLVPPRGRSVHPPLLARMHPCADAAKSRLHRVVDVGDIQTLTCGFLTIYFCS